MFSLDKNNSFHLFPPASALQSTQVRGRFISIRGFNRFPTTHAGKADRAGTNELAGASTGTTVPLISRARRKYLGPVVYG